MLPERCPLAENSKRSGEWPPQHPTPLPVASEFVTSRQFGDFVQEFRGFVDKVDSNFHGIRKEMAEGSTRFALIEREVRDQSERSDEHSGKITALETKENARAVGEDFEARASIPKPHGPVATALISAVITVGATSVCALGYWALSSYFQSQTAPQSTPSAKP